MLTTTSDGNVVLTRIAPEAVSAPGRACLVIEFDKWRELNSDQPAHSTPLNTLIQEYETDPEFSEALQKARRTLAPKLRVMAPNTLREIRLERGLSQTAVAAQIGSTQAQIARVESGKQDVQVGTLIRLAQALSIDPIEAIRAFLTQREEATR
jgi:DNA-binding XRE family transcriptional regulator